MHTKTVSAHMPRRLLMLAGAAVALLAGSGGARAFEYQMGDWQVSLDTTLSSSAEVRTSDINLNYVGFANGGRFPVANADNGDLNFKPGDFVGATQRITTEFQAKKDDYGFFVRATGFYDPIYDDNTNDFRFPLARGRGARHRCRHAAAGRLRVCDTETFWPPGWMCASVTRR
ncbi:MAG: DUF1302 family protein [Rhodospirillales bacterium]